jgi:hypothetical protein
MTSRADVSKLTTKFWYSIGKDTTRFESYLDGPWDLTRPIELRQVARFAAADYHDKHNGWELSWPLEFSLYASAEGECLGRFEVERFMEPTYAATPI